ncbi:MAG: GntR family transcriptional regulator [Actinomycetota bacterium]|nr:GntR family transcriptional regulator [Actinomycetota bacterium]
MDDAAGSGIPAPRPVDRAGALPLWAQLQGDLRRRLAAGEFGEHFPGELELADVYGVSRNTVREALRALRAEGTVIAQRGRRPQLNATIRQPLGTPYSLYDAIEATGYSQRGVVHRLGEVRDSSAAARLGLEAREPLFHLERLRLIDSEPLALEWIWSPLSIAGPLLAADFSVRGFYDELEARAGVQISAGSEHLRAVVPSASERRYLGLGRNGAAFEIERLGLAGTQRVEWRRTLVRGDRFGVVAEFRGPRASRAGLDLLAGTLPLPPPDQAQSSTSGA